MEALAFVLFWVVVGVALFVVALSGGPRRARERVLHSQSRRGRRTTALVLAAAFIVFGLVLPAISIFSTEEGAQAGAAGVKLNASEERGRLLFGQNCNQCHILAAANTAGRTGPSLDKLNPPKSLVLNAIREGRSRGAGRMPAGLLSGQDAVDVAAFVDKVAGTQ